MDDSIEGNICLRCFARCVYNFFVAHSQQTHTGVMLCYWTKFTHWDSTGSTSFVTP